MPEKHTYSFELILNDPRQRAFHERLQNTKERLEQEYASHGVRVNWRMVFMDVFEGLTESGVRPVDGAVTHSALEEFGNWLLDELVKEFEASGVDASGVYQRRRASQPNPSAEDEGDLSQTLIKEIVSDFSSKRR